LVIERTLQSAQGSADAPPGVKMKIIAWLTAALILLSGCEMNALEKHYLPAPGLETVFTNPKYEHPTGDVKIYSYSGDTSSGSLRAQEEGYEYLGMSSYYGRAESASREAITEHAKKVGASMVLVQAKYKDTLPGVVPAPATGYDSEHYGALANSKYSTTSTQGGKMSNEVPYTVTTYDIVATYWVHRDMNQVHLGVVAEALPEDARARLLRSTGVIASVVMRGTPAFNANILRNDVILNIGGEDVIDPQGFNAQVDKFQGQTVDIKLVRGDTPKTVTVTLNRPR
jgi:hypothetical protein